MRRRCFLALIASGIACGKSSATTTAPVPAPKPARAELPFELTYDRFGGMSNGSSARPPSPLLVLYRNGRAEIGGQAEKVPAEVWLSLKQTTRIGALIAGEPTLGSFDWKSVHKQIGVPGTDRVSVLIEVKGDGFKQSAWIYAFEQLVGAQGPEVSSKLSHAKTVPGFVRFSEVASELDALRSELLAAHNATVDDSGEPDLADQ